MGQHTVHQSLKSSLYCVGFLFNANIEVTMCHQFNSQGHNDLFWVQIRVDKTKLEQIIIWPNFIFGQLFILNLGRYDFLRAIRVILSNIRTDSNLT